MLARTLSSCVMVGRYLISGILLLLLLSRTAGAAEDSSSLSEECVLISGTFAILLQVMIGVGALLSLVYKRYMVEKEPRRPFDIWVMDVTKQVIQSVFVHFSNIGLAIIISDVALSGDKDHDECAFYFMSFTLDTFVGIVIIWIVLQGSSYLANIYDIAPLKQHGYYGEPPQVDWYVMQLGVFIFATLCSKSILGGMMYVFSGVLDLFGDWLFSPMHGDPEVELTLVMVVCPFFMSVIQYWIIDTFLMDKSVSSRHAYVFIGDDKPITSDLSSERRESGHLDYFRPI